MKTDHLIAALAADTSPGPRPEQGLPWLALALALAGVALYTVLGLRANPAAGLAPLALPKTLLPLALAALAVPLVLRLAQPGKPTGRLPRLMLAVPLAAASAAGLALLTSDPSGWQMQATGKTMIPCLVTIPLVATLPLGTLLLLLRRGAALAPTRTGLVAGLAAGGLAAALYSLHCTEDSPLFWALWYSTAIGITGAIGALLGNRLLRW